MPAPSHTRVTCTHCCKHLDDERALAHHISMSPACCQNQAMRDSSRVREQLETLKRKHESGDALDLGPSIGPEVITVTSIHHPDYNQNLPSADLLEQLPPASGLARNTGLSTSTTADDSVQATVPHPLHTPSSKPTTQFAQQFPPARKAGLPCGVGRTSFDLVRDAQLAAAVEGKEDSIWSPFSDVDDWEFARWIVQTIGHNATQALLKLGIVSVIIVS